LDPLEEAGGSLTLEPEFSISDTTRDATGSTYFSSKTSLLEFRDIGILACRLSIEPVREDTKKGAMTY
jgi:hypothetical protein